jgi:hypothetical protein
MQPALPPRRGHPAEPAPGTFLTAVGGNADLFDPAHYPVSARCRICREPIRAESFLRAFEHDADA